MRPKAGKPFCHRCMAAAVFAITDTNLERGLEEWYQYQAKLDSMDKRKFEAKDPKTQDENCRHCGHAKKRFNAVNLFTTSP